MKKNDQNESQSMQSVAYAESQDPDTVIEQPQPMGMPAPGGANMPGGALPYGAGGMPGGALPPGVAPASGGAFPPGVAPASGGAFPPGVAPAPGGAKPGMRDVPMPGGTTNRSYQAPKTIHSSTITEFSTHFFVYDPEDDSLSGNYYFILKKSNEGKLMLKEDYKYGIVEEVTPDVFDKIQKIIERNNLVKLNGTDRVTHGLPAEYQPCYLSAVYDSGEKLYFSMNNEPRASWALELESTLREEFAKRGHKKCLAPPLASNIENFNIEFLEGDLVYKYDLINSKKYIMRSVYNRAKNKRESEKIIEAPDGFYADLHNYIKSHNFRRFHTGNVSFESQWKQGKPRYFSFYFYYENKKQLATYSADTNECNDFYREIPGLKAFFDNYIDAPNAIDGSESIEKIDLDALM